MRSQLYFAFLVGVLAIGCGDDEDPNPPGDGNPQCTGHLCEPGLSDPDGGQVLFEYIYFDTQLQAALGVPETAARVMAFFMNAHDPNNTPLPMPGQCTNLEANNGWPLFRGANREDLDIGTLTFTGKNEANADVTWEVPKQAAGNDMIGRPHNVFYQSVVPNAGTQIKPNSSYTMRMSGGSGIPASTFEDGIFLAETFEVNNPGLEDNGPLIGGQDFTVNWTPVTSSNLPAGDTVLGITWLLDVQAKPTHICPVLLSAGTFTIPGETINEYKAIAQARGLPTTNAVLLRNAIVHKVSRLPNGEDDNVRRIDMLSVLCWAQLVDVQ